MQSLKVYVSVYNGIICVSKNNLLPMPTMDFTVETPVTCAQLRNDQVLRKVRTIVLHRARPMLYEVE